MLWFVVKGFLPLPKKKIVGRWSGGAHLHKSNGGVYLCSQNMSSEGGIYKDFWYDGMNIISSRLLYFHQL